MGATRNMRRGDPVNLDVKSSHKVTHMRAQLSRIAVLAASVVALMAAPQVLNSRLLFLGTSALVFSIATMALGLLYGEVGQMSVAHGALFGVGAYTAALLVHWWDFPFIATIPLAMLAGVLVAIAVGYPSLRVRGHYFLIVTFAFAELFRVLLTNMKDLTGGTQGIFIVKEVALPWLGDTEESFYYLTVAVVLLVMGVLVMLKRSALGRTFRLVRDSETLAQSLGVNTAFYKILGFALSGAICALAGVFYAFLVDYLVPGSFGAFAGIAFVLILLIGGSQSILGPLVGSVVYFGLPEVLGLDAVDAQISYGLLLVAVVLFAPSGLAVAIPTASRRMVESRRRVRREGKGV